MLRYLSEALSSLWSFLSVHWDPVLTVGAFVVALIDLVLHIIAHCKEKVRLRIVQLPASSYSFSLTWFDRYDLLFFQVEIDNLSREPVTLADIKLIAPDGKSYPAAEYTLGDHHNDRGLTLYNPTNRHRGNFFNLKTENLISDTRFDANDSKSGYLVFFDVPPVESPSSKFKLSVRAGKKRYSVPITVTPLPDNLSPWSELPKR